MALIEKLRAIGDGFRLSRGTEQEFTLDEMAEMASEPVNVQPKLQSKSVNPTTEKQTIIPDADYNGLSQVEVAAVKQANPADIAIRLNSQQGIVIATATQEEGYITENVQNERLSLPTIANKTITPGTADQTIAAGNFLTGVQTIKGDSNLVPDNIKKGVSIFNVIGTLEGGSDGGVDSGTLCKVTIIDDYGLSKGDEICCYTDVEGTAHIVEISAGIQPFDIPMGSRLIFVGSDRSLSVVQVEASEHSEISYAYKHYNMDIQMTVYKPSSTTFQIQYYDALGWT